MAFSKPHVVGKAKKEGQSIRLAGNREAFVRDPVAPTSADGGRVSRSNDARRMPLPDITLTPRR